MTLVSGHGADLRGVADARGDGGIQDNSSKVARMGLPKYEGCLGLELSTSGQDDDVLQKSQSAGFAAVLVIDFTIDVICIGELDQPRAGFEVAVVPSFEDQPRARALSNKPGNDVLYRAVCLRERHEHELARE